jgi:VWFA-related protein
MDPPASSVDTMTRPLIIVAFAIATSWLQQPAPPAFRATGHGVTVDVAVFDGDRVVTGLRAEDFDFRDNGVRQKIAAVDFNVLPLDLRLVFDMSGSISEDDLELYLQAMRQVAATLQRRDQCEIITFDARIADAASRQSPPIAINLQRGKRDATTFFDAVTLAMVTVPALDRRQVTIVLSDARDNASFLDETSLLEAARRTDAVVYTVLPGAPASNRGVSIARLQSLAMLTGGRMVQAHERAVGRAVITALDEFRQSYLLRYTPEGVPPEGWHRLQVEVRNRGYRIRAKAGYFGR